MYVQHIFNRDIKNRPTAEDLLKHEFLTSPIPSPTVVAVAAAAAVNVFEGKYVNEMHSALCLVFAVSSQHFVSWLY